MNIHRCIVRPNVPIISKKRCSDVRITRDAVLSEAVSVCELAGIMSAERAATLRDELRRLSAPLLRLDVGAAAEYERASNISPETIRGQASIIEKKAAIREELARSIGEFIRQTS